MRLQRWEVILLVLAATSLIVFGVARIFGARTSTSEGVVSRAARPAVAFWGESVDVELRIDADDLPTCVDSVDVEPIYAALAIDHSGSMAGPPLAAARNAASDFVQLMNLSEEGDAVSIVMFDDVADRLTSFSYDWSQVVRSIQGIPDGGGTDIAAGMVMAGQQFLVSSPPNNARRVIILLSDGQSDASSAIAAADAAKAQGIRVVTIALGNADRATLAQIATSDADYYETADPATLLEIYGEIAAGMVGMAATDVVLDEYYNDEPFDLIDTGLYRAQQTPGQIVWQLPFIGSRGRSVGYFLDPTSLGWHQVSPSPGQMTLVDCNDQTVSQITPDGPRVLVLFPAWVLFVAPAGATIWGGARLLSYLRARNQPVTTPVKPGPRSGSATSGQPIEKEPPKLDMHSVTYDQDRYKRPRKRS